MLIISLEDLIVDRLAAWQLWKSDVDGINAYLLVAASGAKLDEARLRRSAGDAQVERALDRLERLLARHPDTEPSQADLDEWSRTALEEGK